MADIAEKLETLLNKIASEELTPAEERRIELKIERLKRLSA